MGKSTARTMRQNELPDFPGKDHAYPVSDQAYDARIPDRGVMADPSLRHILRREGDV